MLPQPLRAAAVDRAEAIAGAALEAGEYVPQAEFGPATALFRFAFRRWSARRMRRTAPASPKHRS